MGNEAAVFKHAPGYPPAELFDGDIFPYAGPLVERQFRPKINLRRCQTDFDYQIGSACA